MQYMMVQTESYIPEGCQIPSSADGKQKENKEEPESHQTEFRIACLIVLRSDNNPNICQR